MHLVQRRERVQKRTSDGRRTFRNSSGVAMVSRLPASRTAIREARVSASATSCVTKTEGVRNGFVAPETAVASRAGLRDPARRTVRRRARGQDWLQVRARHPRAAAARPTGRGDIDGCIRRAEGQPETAVRGRVRPAWPGPHPEWWEQALCSAPQSNEAAEPIS